jgi:hypothetical protein
MRTRSPLNLLPILATVAGAISTPALGQNSGAVFAGVETGRDWTVYAGANYAPSPEPWAGRVIVSAAGYDYRSNGVTIDGDYRQVEFALLRQSSGAWGYLNVGAGARLNDTDLSPDDLGSDRRGTRWDAIVTADGVRRAGAWEAGGYLVYAVDAEDYFARARVTRAIGSGPLRLGAEVTAQGDPNYDRQGAALVALHRRGPVEWSLAGGVRGGEAHISLGIVKSF